MLFLILVGSKIYYLNYIVLFLKLLWFIVTMWVPFIYQEIRYNISVPSILRWTFILSGKRSLKATYEFYMFLPVIRSSIFLPRAYLVFYLKIFEPVSAFVNLLFRLRGCVRIYNTYILYLCISPILIM